MSLAQPLGRLCVAAVLPLLAACANLAAASTGLAPDAAPAALVQPGPRDGGGADQAASPPRVRAADRYRQAMTALATEQGAEPRAQAIAELRQAAESGYAAAQHRLAEYYWVTAENAEDRANALAWFERAAHQGDADAAFRMGDATLNGQGVKANGRRAAAWFRKASEDEVAEAQYMLGVIHLAGHGVEQDPAEADRWFTRAAANGHPDAARQLKTMRRKDSVAGP